MRRATLFFTSALGVFLNSNTAMSLEITQGQFLNVTGEVTFASKYMTDGFNIGGNNPVWQPSVGVDLFSTGFSTIFWSAIQLNRNNQQYDEYDFIAQYGHDFFLKKQYAINLHGSFDYWTFPNSNVADYDAIAPQRMRGNKIAAGITAPHLIPIGDSFLIPSYNAYYNLYWAQNRPDRFEGGTRHELLLQYSYAIRPFIPGAKAHYLGASGSINYNDGAFGVTPGWSHATAQVGTSLHALDCVFSLSLNRQWSYDPSVDPNQELWTSASVTKQF